MTKKQQKEFNAMTRKLMKQKKTTNSWWVQRPMHEEKIISLAAMRRLWKRVSEHANS